MVGCIRGRVHHGRALAIDAAKVLARLPLLSQWLSRRALPRMQRCGRGGQPHQRSSAPRLCAPLLLPQAAAARAAGKAARRAREGLSTITPLQPPPPLDDGVGAAGAGAASNGAPIPDATASERVSGGPQATGQAPHREGHNGAAGADLPGVWPCQCQRRTPMCVHFCFRVKSLCSAPFPLWIVCPQ